MTRSRATSTQVAGCSWRVFHSHIGFLNQSSSAAWHGSASGPAALLVRVLFPAIWPVSYCCRCITNCQEVVRHALATCVGHITARLVLRRASFLSQPSMLRKPPRRSTCLYAACIKELPIIKISLAAVGPAVLHDQACTNIPADAARSTDVYSVLAGMSVLLCRVLMS